MPWSTSRPRSRNYSTAHQKTRAAHMASLKATGYGYCAELHCLYRSRLITPAMKLHLCHDRRTGQVLGLGHKKCNESEAARYARAKQNLTRRRW